MEFFKKLRLKNNGTTDRPKHAKDKVPIEQAINLVKNLVPFNQKSQQDILLDFKKQPVHILNISAGSVIFAKGDEADTTLYLLDGSLLLGPNEHDDYRLIASSQKARYPLSNSQTHILTAIADTDVKLLEVSKVEFFRKEIDSVKVKNNLLSHLDNLNDRGVADKIMHHFIDNTTSIPMLPHVALKLREAVQQEIGVGEAANIVKTDLAIASKLIQICNSPLYRGVDPIQDCRSAIARLGLVATRNIVMTMVMKELFQGEQKVSQQQHVLWKQSINVSSISYALAKTTGRIDPDEALLAGLVHNVGAIPVLRFFEELSVNYNGLDELKDLYPLLQQYVGSTMLEKLTFPDVIYPIPMIAEDWFFDSGDVQIRLSEIVILAKYHSYLGTEKMNNLPPLYLLPAFHKLGDQALTPDSSLQALRDAQQEIAEVINFFKG